MPVLSISNSPDRAVPNGEEALGHKPTPDASQSAAMPAFIKAGAKGQAPDPAAIAVPEDVQNVLDAVAHIELAIKDNGRFTGTRKDEYILVPREDSLLDKIILKPTFSGLVEVEGKGEKVKLRLTSLKNILIRERGAWLPVPLSSIEFSLSQHSERVDLRGKAATVFSFDGWMSKTAPDFVLIKAIAEKALTKQGPIPQDLELAW